MAFDPDEADLMLLALVQQLFPQVCIERRLFIALFQPFLRQLAAQPLVMEFTTYCESL